MRYQRTIKKDIYISGIGLHCGQLSTLVLKPAPEDTGVVFYRKDKNVYLQAHVGQVLDTTFATTIGNERAKVRTVEHLLASLYALGIDNVYIEVDGPEIPILDGSAIEFATHIITVGIKKQKEKMPFIKITKPVTLNDGDKGNVSIYPYEGLRITFRMLFENHFLGEQVLTVDLNEEVFVTDIAPARTFGFLKDIQYFRKMGLAKGGSLENAVVFSESAVLNESGLRFTDECVRHKILDSIGDFSLIGFPIQGHIIANKSGHTMNVGFLKRLLMCSECWEVVTEREFMKMPVLSYSYV
ncbi:MAG: UDP-3-O-acyl-N-acetylglucosamine deacetylase [Candidatus Magnetoovum sp. WYHC-5]|nr:UDP-3-O-acyl-N-acetylglucosamine deacetylase [Candidatus Magnetoovum sp. WYHC-5]